jgi:hypothetical protein
MAFSSKGPDSIVQSQTVNLYTGRGALHDVTDFYAAVDRLGICVNFDR